MMYEALTTMTLFEANVAVPKSALKSILTTHQPPFCSLLANSNAWFWRGGVLLNKRIWCACSSSCSLVVLHFFSALFLWCICCNVWDTMELGFVPTCFAWQSTIGGLTKYKTDNSWSHLTNPSTEHNDPRANYNLYRPPKNGTRL